MHRLTVATLRVSFIAAVAVATAGCGGGSEDDAPSLDPKRVEQEITEGVSEDLGVQLDVECPSDRPIEKGDKFQCLASSEDTDDLEIDVRQVNNRGSVRWDARILTTERYETNISQFIQQQRKLTVDITCPDAVPIEEGGEFTCEARDPKTGETRDVQVVQKDEEGNISFSS